MIDECKQAIKPYEELWILIRDFGKKHQQWMDDELQKLDPEEVEKDHKTMFQTAAKLANRFNALKIHRPEKLANDIKDDLIKFREYLPVIRALCNPGLKERHKVEMGRLINKTIE